MAKKEKEKEKDKKSKKDGKKEKKEGKKAEKQKRRAEKAEEWFCHRLDASRLIKQMLQIDEGLASELEELFDNLDDGEEIKIDSLDDKQARKKLRHLMQCLRATPVGSQGFKSPDLEVSFTSIYCSCLEKARKDLGSKQGASASAASAVPLDEEDAEEAAASGGPAMDLPDDEAVEAPVAKRSRLRGPQLPTPGVGPATGDGNSSDEDEAERGPKVEGEERRGVDLQALRGKGNPSREEWMMVAPGYLDGTLGAGEQRRREGGAYEVKRSAEEEAKFETMMKERGASLLSQTMEGRFTGNEEELKKLRKRQAASQEVWGRGDAAGDPGGAGAAMMKAGGGGDEDEGWVTGFDPEQELQVRKPISAEQFSKYVETSTTKLGERFSRGQVATSFL